MIELNKNIESKLINVINMHLEYQISILRKNYIQLDNVYDKNLNVIYMFDNNKLIMHVSYPNNLEIKQSIQINKKGIKQKNISINGVDLNDIDLIRMFSEENIKSAFKLNKLLSINDINFKQIKNFKSLSFSNFNIYFENFDILSLTTDLIIPEIE